MNTLTAIITPPHSRLASSQYRDTVGWKKKLTARQIRALEALIKRPDSREELDKIIGTSNSPNTIFQLRRRGYDIPLSWKPHIDRDGRIGKHGIYSLSSDDRNRLGGWQ